MSDFFFKSIFFSVVVVAVIFQCKNWHAIAAVVAEPAAAAAAATVFYAPEEHMDSSQMPVSTFYGFRYGVESAAGVGFRGPQRN